MSDDIIEIKEKLNWKELFYEQSRICRAQASLEHAHPHDRAATKLSFRLWYNLIPDDLKDNVLEESWRSIVEDGHPHANNWIDLYQQFWNWGYRHALVLTIQQYNQDEELLAKTKTFIESRNFEELWNCYFSEGDDIHG